jgi:chemotaxis family two-component system response regulator Rcp1
MNVNAFGAKCLAATLGAARWEGFWMTHVLLVEDNPADIRLTREAFAMVDSTLELHVVGDGLEAISYLNNEGIYTDAPRPDMILLDLNLPKKDGREVLSFIKNDNRLKAIPTCVLSSSGDDEDVRKCYERLANWYITKPMELDALEDRIRRFHDYWYKRVVLPPILARIPMLRH